jgi:hypothetical protein
MAISPVTLGKNGWITVMTRYLVMPPCCVNCLGRHERFHPYKVGATVWTIYFLSLGQVHETREYTVDIPTCKKCYQQSLWRGRIRGMIAGLLFGSILSGLLFWGTEIENKALLIPICLVIGGLFGLVIGGGANAGLPVRLKNYSLKHNTLMVRFGRPQYQQRFLKSVQNYADSTNPFADEA